VKILLAGDTHGNSSHTMGVFAHARRLEADAVFQLGDFGFGWRFGQRKGSGEQFCVFTDHVSNFAATTDIPCYWIGGNHENYDRLEELLDGLEPQPDGTYKVASRVFYVPRGTELEFGGKSFLCCGGGTSIDKKMRTPYVSWWPQEAITDDDVWECAERGQCDVLLSHDFPWECEVIDRHLDPFWGVEAQEQVMASRNRISAIAGAAAVRNIFHGHLHVRYDEDITIQGRPVHVTGLDCDGTAMKLSTLLLDTDTLD
jgi:predicted phosphodiesterase